MTIYRKVIRSTVTCEAIEVSELDEKKFELEEVELEELFDKYENLMAEEKEYPEIIYDEREFEQSTEYSLCSM